MTGEDDKNFGTYTFYRYIIVIGHYILCNDYCLGYEWIGDIQNITFSVIKQMNPIILHKAMTLIVEALAQRIKRIHIISGSKFFDTAISLIRQGLSAKLKERIIVHPNVESLYKYLPREQLPKEYGGGGRSMKEMNDTVFKELATDEHIEKVKHMESFSSDESCRLSCEFNEEYSGMPGCFKTLCID